MAITRHNYEEYFLLYADDELSAAERREVEDFLELHPDLVGELDVQAVGVGFGVNRHAANAEFFAGANDADGDFATIGNEDFVEQGRSLLNADGEQFLAKLDRLGVFDEALDDRAFDLGLDLVHHLHGFDDADDALVLDGFTGFGVGRSVRRGGAVERADHRRGNIFDVHRCRRDSRHRRSRRWCNRDWRRCRDRGRRGCRDGHRLLEALRAAFDANFQAIFLQRELRQLVLFHHFDDGFDLIQFHGLFPL